MKVIRGDLIKLAVEGEAKIIVHGCNCFHAMGSGIAGVLAGRFPEIPQADKAGTKYGSPDKLGSYSVVHVTKELSETSSGEIVHVPLEHQFKCINLYTQFVPGPDFIQSVFEHGLRKLNKDFKGKTLWFPMIGCGIGGGDWSKVMPAMLHLLTDVEAVVVVL